MGQHQRDWPWTGQLIRNANCSTLLDAVHFPNPCSVEAGVTLADNGTEKALPTTQRLLRSCQHMNMQTLIGLRPANTKGRRTYDVSCVAAVYPQKRSTVQRSPEPGAVRSTIHGQPATFTSSRQTRCSAVALPRSWEQRIFVQLVRMAKIVRFLPRWLGGRRRQLAGIPSTAWHVFLCG